MMVVYTFPDKNLLPLDVATSVQFLDGEKVIKLSMQRLAGPLIPPLFAMQLHFLQAC